MDAVLRRSSQGRALGARRTISQTFCPQFRQCLPSVRLKTCWESLRAPSMIRCSTACGSSNHQHQKNSLPWGIADKEVWKSCHRLALSTSEGTRWWTRIRLHLTTPTQNTSWAKTRLARSSSEVEAPSATFRSMLSTSTSTGKVMRTQLALAPPVKTLTSRCWRTRSRSRGRWWWAEGSKCTSNLSKPLFPKVNVSHRAY